MKLQKQFAYEYKGKKHYKSILIIPNNVVLKLGWKYGQELESKIEGDKLILNMKRNDSNDKI